MEKVEETQKKNAKTSKEKIDPTMDFFNLGSSFTPQVIKTSKEIIDHSKKPTAPPIISQDDDDEFYDCVETSSGVEKTRNEFKYAEEIKATEMKMYKLLREKDRKKKIQNRSSLSNIEDNTMSIIEKPSTIPDDTHLGKYFDFTKKRCVDLAIAKDEDAIINLIRKERVSIICGHTGSGKTTQVPQFILDDHARRGKSVNILVTQPRKIAAKSIAKRICHERNWEMGRIVGYKVGLDKENASLDTRLLFCTTGIFKKMIIAKKNLNDWTHIILDEVHEREMDMDFVLLLCKRLINTNSSNVKLILMSATIDTARFQKYFSWSGPDAERGCHYTAEVYSMKETNKYSVKEIYLDELEKDKKIRNNISAWPYNFEVESPYVIDECVNIASQIILKLNDLEQKNNIQEQGAVLVFLPGEAEIARVKKCFHEISKNHQVPWWLLPLHSRIPFEETQRIFDVKKGYRKVILSTNVAESSLTIPDVCYVIDFCLQKLIMADQYTNYVSLRLQWADKNSCTQRKGRAGRVRSGIVFRLVPKEFYDMLDESVTAEMIRAPLEKVILDTKLLDFGPPRELLALAMDPPKLKNIHKTTMRLKEIGALQTTTNGSVNLDDGDLTVLGEIIASLPVDISLGKLIALGHILNILDECIIIAAGMSNNSLFSMPFGRKLKAFADKLCWSNNSFSDCLAILVAYQTWNNKLRTGEFNRIPEVKWCQERHLQVKVLHEMREAIEDIKLALQRHHIDILDLPNRCDRRQYNADHIISSSYKDIVKLKIAIFGAFYPNYFVRTGLGLEEKEVYKELYNNTTCSYNDPCSCVYFSNFDPQQTPFSSLYVDQIKSMFDGIDSRNINVEFDRQKIIVQFANDTGRRNMIFADQNSHRYSTSIMNESVIKNCDILQEVYIAMKLRREPSEMMRLKLFPPEIAQQKMLFIDQHIRGLHLSSNRIILYQDIGIRNPPALAQSILHLEINYANNPNSFWINYLSPENQNANDNQLANLDTEIENIMASKKYLKTIDANNIEINQLFLAPYEGMYYRARVDSVIESEKSVKAFFVDYGNIEIIHMSKLLVIDKDLTQKFSLLTTPALAHECSLSLTKPNPRRKYDCGWDEYSVTQFKNIIECDNIQEPVTFVGKVLSVVPNVAMKAGHLIHLTLFKNTNHLDVNDQVNYDYKKSINHQFQCLQDKNGHHLAVYTAENYMSQLNSQLRESHNSFSDIEKAEREKCQLSFIGDKSKKQLEDSILSSSILNNKTRVDQRTMGVQLKGPYHPLQFSVTATHRIGSCKKASVEPDSVNSVLLDKSPNDRHDAWLVAGHVGTNPTGDSLVLRSTTLMPNIKGLGALLAMTFSPEVEMRYDSKMQKYTGCLLGLGSRKRRNYQSESQQTLRSSTYLEEDWNSYINDSSEYVPYHSEHDMELQFDVNVDNDDISLINQLRYRLSIAFTRINQRREDGCLLPLEQRMREIPARLTISNYLIEDQDKIDELFDQLLSRKRKVISKQHFRNEHHWCQLPPARMLYHPHIHNEHELLLKMITQISFTNRKK